MIKRPPPKPRSTYADSHGGDTGSPVTGGFLKLLWQESSTIKP